MDEADQMLEARFLEQIHCILSVTWPTSTQVVLMSATMIEDVQAVAGKLLRKDRVQIIVPPEEVTLEGIKQLFVPVEKEEHKLDTLCDLYDHLTITQANIFVNTKEGAVKLATQMRKRGFDLECIHGDMTVEERRKHMSDFRSGKTRVLISTDMLARGIDVQQVQLVINYELPVQRENYIHRIGRSARYGRKGASINLVSEREFRAQEEIEKYYSTKVRELPMDLDIY
jgi:superfamily II DNA/RNA helicase